MKFSPTYRLISVHIFCHLMIIPMVIYGTWQMFLLGFIWWQWVAATAISSGYHRYASHNSFKTKKWYEYYFNVMGLFANAGPVLTWAATHRMHHMFSDTDKDPHSPKHMSALKVYFGYWGQNLIIIPRSLGKLHKNDIYMFFYKHYFRLQVLIAISFFLISPHLFLFGFCLPIVFALHGFGSVNWLTHRYEGVRNSSIANILTGGEGWHKNHHEKPYSWKLGWTKMQIDPGAWFIKLIKTNQ